MATRLKGAPVSRTKSTRGHAQRPTVTVTTLSGRAIPPPPQIRVTSARTAARDLIQQRAWLIEQVQTEARERRDHYAQTLFSRLDPRNFPPAEAASCCVYLFGEMYPEFDATTGALLPPS